MIVKRKQKDYSLISDLRHSGIKRTGQKYIGRTRVKIANTLQKSIYRSAKRGIKANEMVLNASTQNPAITKNLIGIAKNRYNTRVLALSNLHSPRNIAPYTTTPLNASRKDIPKVQTWWIAPYDVRRDWRKILNTKGVNDHLIFIQGRGKDSIMTLPHELGHVEANISNPKMWEQGNEARRILGSSDTGIGAAIKKFKAGRIELAEEKDATKRGLRLLKEAGASKEELKTARKEGLAGIRSHAEGNRVRTKSALRDAVELPSTKLRPDGNTAERISRDKKRSALRKQRKKK